MAGLRCAFYLKAPHCYVNATRVCCCLRPYGCFYQFVIPAKAGIQFFMNHLISLINKWIPACAGTTNFEFIEAPLYLPKVSASATVVF